MSWKVYYRVQSIHGFQTRARNSEEYNAVLRLVSFLPFKKHGARAVTEMKEKRECRDSSVLRPQNDHDELRRTRNGKVPSRSQNSVPSNRLSSPSYSHMVVE